MNNFDLKSIIDLNKLDPKTVAAELFPENKYPMIALSRIINGEALLNTDQISKLSFMTGIPFNDLFSGGSWAGKPSENDNTMVFENGEYRAELDRSTWVTKLYHKNSIFHEAVIMDGDKISFSKYLTELDNLILNK